MNKYAIYIRVSTKKQDASGLGLESQRDICMKYINSKNGILLAEFKDIKSGKKEERAGLLNAIDYCKANNCTLVISKLDRLARNVEFTFRVINTGIDIYFCDMPNLNTLVLGMMATVAQYERELISKRSKDALLVKKKKGEPLGRASENYTINKEAQEQRAYNIGKTQCLNNLKDPKTICLLRHFKRVVPELEQASTNDELFFLKWTGKTARIKKKHLIEITRNINEFNRDIFPNGLTMQEAKQMYCNKIRAINRYNEVYK